VPVKLPKDEEELQLFVDELRTRLQELEERSRHHDHGAYKSLKIVRKQYNELQRELWRSIRHERDDERREFLETILGRER